MVAKPVEASSGLAVGAPGLALLDAGFRDRQVAVFGIHQHQVIERLAPPLLGLVLWIHFGLDHASPCRPPKRARRFRAPPIWRRCPASGERSCPAEGRKGDHGDECMFHFPNLYPMKSKSGRSSATGRGN